MFFKLSKLRTSKAMVFSACHGALAQLGERGLCKPEVRGSIPLRSTIRESDEHLRVFVLFLSDSTIEELHELPFREFVQFMPSSILND